MNVRQKAKYYKRKYEETKYDAIPVKCIVTRYNVDTLKAERLCPKDLIENNDENIKVDIFTRALAQDLAAQGNKYMTITSHYEPSLRSYIVSGEIKVVSNY